MQQNVASPAKNRLEESRAGEFVERRRQGKYTWRIRIIRGGSPINDKRQVLQQSGVKV